MSDPHDSPEVLANIESEQYYHFPGTYTIVCCIKMRNNWTSTGTSSCMTAHKFDLALGEERAFNQAMSEIRRMESYARAKQRHER